MNHVLSIWGQIDAWLGWVSIGAGVLYAAIAGLFRGPSGADSYHHLIQSATKKLTSRFTPLQIHAGIEPNFVSNDRGLKGFWIGSPTAKYVVINFHGGGFAMDATGPYLDFWPTVAKEIYYRLFREAVEALRYIIKGLGRSPSEVIFVGDSTGANLCLVILSHLSHPSQDVTELRIAEPLKALVLMSPWISFRHDWPSMTTKEHKDIDAREVIERWSQDYLNGVSTNHYAEAVEAPETWWVGSLVNQTLVLAGNDEVLLDSITTWVQRFSKSNPDKTLVIGQKECHIAPLIWPLFHDHHETQQALALKSWLCERLRT